MNIVFLTSVSQRGDEEVVKEQGEESLTDLHFQESRKRSSKIKVKRVLLNRVTQRTVKNRATESNRPPFPRGKEDDGLEHVLTSIS